MATTTNYGWETPDDTDLVKDGAAAIRTLGNSVDTTTKNLNPETTLGDLAYRSATANVNTRLPLGTANQVLRVNSGGTAPEWATTADQTPLTTKGDLFTFTTADARLGVGANGTVLTADSAEATGLKWVATTSSALVLVKRSTFSSVASTTTTFDGVFTSTYGSYIVCFEEALAGSSPFTQDIQMLMRVGGVDQTNAYYATSNTKQASGSATQTFYGTNYDTKFTVAENSYIYGTLQFNRPSNFFSGALADEITGGFCNIIMNYQTSPVDGFKLQCSSGNISGTVAIYGLAKS